MTIAVAVRKGGETVIAADTQNNFGHNRAPIANHRTQKILTVGGNHLATSGWGLYANILDDFLGRKRLPKLDTERDVFRFFQAFWKALHEHYSLVNDQCQNEEERSPFGDLDASFLLANAGGIFYVSSDTSVTAFEQYYAVGSGAEFALGALHAAPLGQGALRGRSRHAVLAVEHDGLVGELLDRLGIGRDLVAREVLRAGDVAVLELVGGAQVHQHGAGIGEADRLVRRDREGRRAALPDLVAEHHEDHEQEPARQERVIGGIIEQSVHGSRALYMRGQSPD